MRIFYSKIKNYTKPEQQEQNYTFSGLADMFTSLFLTGIIFKKN